MEEQSDHHNGNDASPDWIGQTYHARNTSREPRSDAIDAAQLHDVRMVQANLRTASQAILCDYDLNDETSVVLCCSIDAQNKAKQQENCTKRFRAHCSVTQ